MDRRTLARQLSAIENGEMKVESYVDGDVIAITGPPGVGKSCIVDSILHRLAPAKILQFWLSTLHHLSVEVHS